MKDLLNIDKYRLDDELVSQPSLYFEWAEKLAEEQRQLESLKVRYELLRSEKEHDVRTNPKSYDLGKVTENAVKEIVDSIQVIEDSQFAIIRQREQVAILAGFVKALEQRKSVLEALVQLFLKQYYSEPRVPREQQEGMRERIIEEVNAQLKDSPRMVRRKR